LAFGVDFDKDVVRRILGKHYGQESGSGGPSWLTFLGQAKDSLWGVDLFRCESLSLRTLGCWWLWTSSRAESSDLAFTAELSICCHCARCSSERFRRKRCRRISARTTIRCIGSPNGQANLRVLEVMEIKTVPYVPLSYPFVERLVGTLKRECLDRTLFWTTADLEAKLREFQKYFNEHRTHAGLEGRLPDPG
jgi:hypothetical protein